MINNRTAQDILISIYRTRRDLQEAFPNADHGDLQDLLLWAVTSGVTIDCAKPLLYPLSKDLATLLNMEVSRQYDKDFIFEIDPHDEMYTNGTSASAVPVLKKIEYFQTGANILKCLEDVLKDNGHSLKQIDSFLDFACGYGRFTRFLINKLDKKKITVSDIDKNAVDFCRRTFGVKAFYSEMDPQKLKHNEKYDLIYVISLFSHLNLQLWTAWLNRLYNMLNKDGLLILSTHGISCFDDQFAEISDGFYFNKVSETARLSTEDYGGAVVTREFVSKNCPGELISYYPKKLNNHQDVYVIRRS